MYCVKRCYAIKCRSQTSQRVVNLDLLDPSQKDKRRYPICVSSEQRLRLFQEVAHPWVWLRLAFPETYPAAEGSYGVGASAPSYAEKASPLERLPLELLATILDHLSCHSSSERSLLAVALASPLLWPAVLDLVRRHSMSFNACIPFVAGLPVILTDLGNYWAYRNRTWPPFDGDTWVANATVASLCDDRMLPTGQRSFDESAWIELATKVLSKKRPWKKLRQGYCYGPDHPHCTQVPLAGVDDGALLGAFKRSICSITTQSWTQPWLLRNISKRLIVQLTPVKNRCGQLEHKHPTEQVSRWTGDESRITPPRLHLASANGHLVGGCDCAVAAEDILAYYIMWFDDPILTPYEGDAVPPDHGEWAGDGFDIIGQDVHEGRTDEGDWRDITVEMRDKFAAIITCGGPGTGWGEPYIPEEKRGVRH